MKNTIINRTPEDILSQEKLTVLIWVGKAFRRFSLNNQHHGIGNRSRKGMTQIPCPWKTQGERQGIMGVKVRQKIKGKGKPWWVFVAHNKRRTSRKVGDKDAAEEVASEIRARLKLGQFSFEEDKPIPTFKKYADSWIKVTVPATCKDSTLSDYQDILKKHIMDEFGDIPINVITRGMVKTFLLKKTNDGYAGSTVSHIRNVVSGVLNVALDDEKIPANPAIGLKGIIKKKPKNDAINPLTAEELSTLLNAVYKHFPKHYPLFLTLARTGMRIGEALALQWDDIIFEERYIHIQRGLARGKISYPKSGKDRKVDMSPQLAETLKYLKGTFRLKIVGDNTEPEYIFKNSSGELVNLNNWRKRIFYKVIGKAEIRKIRIHDLRHTYATLRINKGDNIADVSNQLGHHSVRMILDVYHHWMPGDKKTEVDALDDLSPSHPNAPHMHPATQESEKGAANAG